MKFGNGSVLISCFYPNSHKLFGKFQLPLCGNGCNKVNIGQRVTTMMT